MTPIARLECRLPLVACPIRGESVRSPDGEDAFGQLLDQTDAMADLAEAPSGAVVCKEGIDAPGRRPAGEVDETAEPLPRDPLVCPLPVVSPGGNGPECAGAKAQGDGACLATVSAAPATMAHGAPLLGTQQDAGPVVRAADRPVQANESPGGGAQIAGDDVTFPPVEGRAVPPQVSASPPRTEGSVLPRADDSALTPGGDGPATRHQAVPPAAPAPAPGTASEPAVNLPQSMRKIANSDPYEGQVPPGGPPRPAMPRQAGLDVSSDFGPVGLRRLDMPVPPAASPVPAEAKAAAAVEAARPKGAGAASFTRAITPAAPADGGEGDSIPDISAPRDPLTASGPDAVDPQTAPVMPETRPTGPDPKALPPTGLPESARPPEPYEVARQIVQGCKAARGSAVEVALAPEELGKVRLTLHGQDGVMTVSIQADRAETLDLMRRNSDLLARDFREMGYASVAFSFSDQSGRRQSPASPPEAEVLPPRPERAALAVPTSIPPARPASDGLDLRM